MEFTWQIDRSTWSLWTCRWPEWQVRFKSLEWRKYHLLSCFEQMIWIWNLQHISILLARTVLILFLRFNGRDSGVLFADITLFLKTLRLLPLTLGAECASWINVPGCWIELAVKWRILARETRHLLHAKTCQLCSRLDEIQYYY